MLHDSLVHMVVQRNSSNIAVFKMVYFTAAPSTTRKPFRFISLLISPGTKKAHANSDYFVHSFVTTFTRLVTKTNFSYFCNVIHFIFPNITRKPFKYIFCSILMSPNTKKSFQTVIFLFLTTFTRSAIACR